MWLDTTLAILHHLLAFGLVGLLMAEWALMRDEPSAGKLPLLSRIDLAYGIVAGLLLAIGLLRVAYGVKGSAFYLGNLFFWIKLAAFAIAGGLSLKPTFAFLRWRRQHGERQALPDTSQWLAMRRVIVLELHLLALVMICAALMARGIGTL